MNINKPLKFALQQDFDLESGPQLLPAGALSHRVEAPIAGAQLPLAGTLGALTPPRRELKPPARECFTRTGESSSHLEKYASDRLFFANIC